MGISFSKVKYLFLKAKNFMSDSKVMQVAYSYYALINSNTDNKSFFCLLNKDSIFCTGAQEIIRNIPVSENLIMGFLSPYPEGSMWLENGELLGRIHSFLVTERHLYIKLTDGTLVQELLEDVSPETILDLEACIITSNGNYDDDSIFEKVCSELVLAASSSHSNFSSNTMSNGNSSSSSSKSESWSETTSETKYTPNKMK